MPLLMSGQQMGGIPTGSAGAPGGRTIGVVSGEKVPAGAKRVHPRKVRPHSERVEAAQWSGEWKRIYGDPKTAAHDHVVAHLICQSNARGKELFAGSDSKVVGISANPTQQHIPGDEIVAVEFGDAIALHQWIVFVAETQVRGQFVRNAIAVSDEPAELPLLCSGLNKLIALTQPTNYRSARQAQQELRPGVELVWSRSGWII